MVCRAQRYYNPALGRWTQKDTTSFTITDPGQLNGYTYVADKPANGIDPSGQFSISNPCSACTSGLESASSAVSGAASAVGNAVGNAIVDYGPTCVQGAVQDVGVGVLTGASETGAGLAVTAGVGCATNVTAKAIGPNYGNDLQNGSNLANLVELNLSLLVGSAG